MKQCDLLLGRVKGSGRAERCRLRRRAGAPAASWDQPIAKKRIVTQLSIAETQAMGLAIRSRHVIIHAPHGVEVVMRVRLGCEMCPLVISTGYAVARLAPVAYAS